jgi:hypothetical protein
MRTEHHSIHALEVTTMRTVIGAVLAVLLWGSGVQAECLHSASVSDRQSTESFTPVDVPALSISVTTQGIVLVTGSLSARVQAGRVPTIPVGRVSLMRDNTAIATYSLGALGIEMPVGVGLRQPVSFTVIDSPAPGEHEYRVVWLVANPGTRLSTGFRALQVTGACF